MHISALWWGLFGLKSSDPGVKITTLVAEIGIDSGPVDRSDDYDDEDEIMSIRREASNIDKRQSQCHPDVCCHPDFRRNRRSVEYAPFDIAEPRPPGKTHPGKTRARLWPRRARDQPCVTPARSPSGGETDEPKMRLTVANHDYNVVPATTDDAADSRFVTSTPKRNMMMNIPTAGGDNEITTPNGNLRSPSSDNNESFLSDFVPNDCDGDRIDGSPTTFSSITSKTFESVARRGRLFAKREQRRLVFKDGECNISKNQINQRKRRYFHDLFTTLLELRWRYNLIMFGFVFTVSWLFFGFFWWVICIAHGDHLVSEEVADEHGRCVSNVYSFQTALLFSIETQHTIGYGFRVIEPKCPEAFILLMVQSCLGVFIQSLLTGVIFAKLSRPKRRAKTMMFSKNAVICQRDGELFLLFRVGDMRKSPIIQTNIRCVMVKSRHTKEGELIPLCQFPIELETETSTSAFENFVLLSWPITVVHRINETSPLWEISAEQLLAEQFELVVILEGTIEDTGMLAQMRTSYLPGEIKWGHRLAPLFAFWKSTGQYQVDFTQFDVTIPIETPECSAKDLDARGRDQGQQTPVTLSKEQQLLLSNFLTIPAVHYSKLEASNTSTSSNTSIFKKMRTSLKRRRLDNRQRNGSLPSISYNGSLSGFEELRAVAARARSQRSAAEQDGGADDDDEKEVEVSVSVESSMNCANNDDVNSNEVIMMKAP